MSVLSLDASQSVKLTLMKDISYCLVRSDKLGRRRDVLVMFNDQPEGYVLSYGDWLHFINQVSGRRILFGFYRRMPEVFFRTHPGGISAGAVPPGHCLPPGMSAGDQLNHKQQEPLRMEKLLLFVFCMSRNFLLFR